MKQFSKIMVNIQVTFLMYQLQSLKINTKMQEAHLSQSSPSGIFCKNHPSIPSGYFISDQPWIKYCRNCALNVALSGRRIEKQLSAQEFQRKMQISTTVNELRNSLILIDQSSEHYRRLTEILEQVASPLAAHIKDVETALRNLSEAKEKLEGLYVREVGEKVHAYYERQSKMALMSLQVKKELEAIESSYGNLIELQEESMFQHQKQCWQDLLENSKKLTINEQVYNEYRVKINNSIEEFYSKLQSISRFAIDIKLQRSKVMTNSDFDITLTPIDSNSLADTVTFEHLRLNLKSHGPLKLKTNKKMITQRDSQNTSKVFTKRKSVCGTESHLQTIRKG